MRTSISDSSPRVSSEKPKKNEETRRQKRMGSCLGLASILLCFASSNAQGQEASWNINANGNWNVGTNWNPSGVPSGIDAIVNFTNSITAARTVTLDMNATVGTLNIGAASGGQAFTLSSSGGSKLTFQTSSGRAALNMINDGGSNTISAGIILANGLDIYINDPTNGQVLNINGLVEGGVAPGEVAINFTSTATNTKNQILQFGNSQNNTFTGRLVVNSGTLRSEGNNNASLFGARGVGNETVITGTGRLDLRDHEFNVSDSLGNTEIIMVEGSGWRGLGALVNSAGTANVSHVIMTGDATFGGQSTIQFSSYTNAATNASVNPILDGGGFALTKLGTNTLVMLDTQISNLPKLNIREGNISLRGSTQLEAGTVINLGYNQDAYNPNVAFNPEDFSQGSRTQNDVNSTTAGTAHVIEAGLEFYGQTNSTYDLTINFGRGRIQRTGAGTPSTLPLNSGLNFYTTINGTINLVEGSSIQHSFISVVNGADGLPSGGTEYEHPGRLTIAAEIVSQGGTGITKRGNRELRLTADNEDFTGRFLVLEQNNRFINRGYNGSNGIVESQYFNLALSDQGTLRNASEILLERGGSISLLNDTINVDNRINDVGLVSMRNGYLHLVTGATLNQENWGNVVSDYGTNWFFIDNRAGGNVHNTFASLTLTEGSVLKIRALNESSTFGAQDSDDIRIAIDDTTSLLSNLVGNTSNTATTDRAVVHGVLGGVIPETPASVLAPHRPEEQLQNALAWGGTAIGFMTLEEHNGKSYLRPLKESEYSTTLSSGVNWNVTSNQGVANAIANVPNVTSDIAVNSLRISNSTLPTAGVDAVYIGPGATLKIDSGMILFSGFGEATSANLDTVIRGGGGFLDMNEKVAIIDSASVLHDTDSTSGSWTSYLTGYNGIIRTHLTNATGLVKTGRNTLYLDTWNDYIGKTYISQGTMIIRHGNALGSSDQVIVTGEGNFYLQAGVNTKADADVYISGYNTGARWALYGNDAKNNVWQGNVIIDSADSSGSMYHSTYIGATNNGTLSIRGDIYGVEHPLNLIDSDLYNNPRVIATDDGTSDGTSSTINLYGKFKDNANGAVSKPIYNRGDSVDALDRNHLMMFLVRGHNEVNVNAFQQWDSAGGINVQVGYFRVHYDPTTANGLFTDAAVNAWHTDGIQSNTHTTLINDISTRFVLGGNAVGMSTPGTGTGTYSSSVLLTKSGQILNHQNIYVYNAASNGNVTLGAENTSGTVYFGSNDSTGSKQARVVLENHGGDRNIRLYQAGGGTSVYNLRFQDGGSSVNSSLTKIGLGTARLVDNTLGTTNVERWNIMGGTMEWQLTQNGNDRFAASSSQLTMGGGKLDLKAFTGMTATRTQNMTGQFRVLAGGSEIRVTGASGNGSAAMNLILGSTSNHIIRNLGGTVLFSKIANGGTVNLALNSALDVDDPIVSTVIPWAVYSEQDQVVNDFAAITPGGAVPYSVVSADSLSLYDTSSTAQDLTQWTDSMSWVTDLNVQGYHGVLSNDAMVKGIRFYGANDATVNIGASNTLVLEDGAILVGTNVGDHEKKIVGGFLTSRETPRDNQNGYLYEVELLIHNYNPTSKFEISSIITDNNELDVTLPLHFTHSGIGTTILSGVNTYSGNNYLVGGKVEISQDRNLGSNDTASTLYLNGGTLVTTDTFELHENRSILLGGSGGAIDVKDGTTLTYSGTIASEGNVVNSDNGYTSNITSNIGVGDFTKLGDGVMVLDGAADNSNFTGMMMIKDGTLKVAVPSNLSGVLGTNQSAIDGTVIYDGATLELATGADWTNTEWITFNGKGHLDGGALRKSGTSFNIRLNGQLNIETDTLISIAGGNIYLNESGGDLFGSGDITRIGAGELRFFGNNADWTGNLILGSGTTWLYNETGKMTNVQSISLNRDGFFALLNEGTSGDPYGDRVNDAAVIEMNGYTRLRMQGQSTVHSGYETFGDLNVKSGLGKLQIFTARSNGSSGVVESPTFAGMIFNSISRQNGAILKLSVNEVGGKFADSSFGNTVFSDVGVYAVKEMPTELLFGGNGSTGTNHSILKGVFGGGYTELLSDVFGSGDSENSAARYLMTVDQAVDPFSGNVMNVIRPLKDSEYRNVGVVGAINEEHLRVKLETQGIAADDNLALRGRETSLANPITVTGVRNNQFTIDGDLTVNSLSMLFQPVIQTTATNNGAVGERNQIYLGEGSTLKINSGVINVNIIGVVDRLTEASETDVANFQSYILGGNLDFNAQEAIINVGSSWYNYNYSGNKGYGGRRGENSDLYINSTITNATGLTKSGERSLILSGRNEYTGDTNVVEGALYVRHSQALGQSKLVNVTGAGQFIVQQGVTVNGVDVRSGITTTGNRSVLILERGSGWGGNVIIDNVDVSGQAGSAGNTVIRNVVRSSSTIGTLYGDIYADPSHAILGANGTTAQMVSTIGSTDGILWLKGSFKDRVDGAYGEKITDANQNNVLRFEIAGNNSANYSTSTYRSANEVAVWVENQWDSVGRINLEQGYLYYFGDGNFWTDRAQTNMTSSNLMSGFHMGGDISSATVTNQNLAVLLTKSGQTFNIDSFGVGLENDLGNRTGNSTLGGVHQSGSVTYGLGTGSITFENAASVSYHRDLRLYQAHGGTTDVAYNLVDGGNLVNSSITKVGLGDVNLLGSSAGDSTVEGVNTLAGRLILSNYSNNLNRRIGENAQLRMGGGALLMMGDAVFTEQFGEATIAAGGTSLIVDGLGTIQLSSNITRNSLGTLHLQETNGGTIRATGVAANSRLGSYATYGISTDVNEIRADAWAATDASGKVVGYSHSSGEVDTFGVGLNTDVQSDSLAGTATASLRFAGAVGSISSGSVILSDGGVLFSSGYSGGNAFATGVSLTTAAENIDLIIHNYANAAVTVGASISGSQNVVFNGKGITVLTGNNTYTGKTAIVGGAVVSIDSVNKLGSAPGSTVSDSLYLNDGSIRYSGSGTENLGGTRGITLGGGGGTIEFVNNGTLIFNGQISTESNPVGSYVQPSGGYNMENNPLSGDLTIKGAGTFRIGEDYVASSFTTANYNGLRNTYSGLTTIGDGVTKTVLQLRGQPQDDQYIWAFGTHEGFADGTVIKNNSEFRAQFQRGTGNTSFDGQVRLLEWFTFGENNTDNTYFFNDTAREIEFAGNLKINGTLHMHLQNTGIDSGNTTTNSPVYFGVNNGYGSQLLGDANSRLIKTGAGTLSFRESNSGFEGTFEVRRGEMQFYGYGYAAGVGEVIHLGDMTDAESNRGDSRINVVQRSSNNLTDITSEAEDLHLYQDIQVYGTNSTTTSNSFLRATLYTDDSSATFHGDIHINSRAHASASSSNAGLYVEMAGGNPLNESITGRQQHNQIYLNGNISGSGSGLNAFIDLRLDDGSTTASFPTWGTFVLAGDNSGWHGELRVAGANTSPDVYERTIVRFANNNALTEANDVRMYYHSYIQAGGMDVTFGHLEQSGGVGVWDENATGTTNSTMTIENVAEEDGYITITENTNNVWNVMFRDGVTSATFGDSNVNGALHVAKSGSAIAVLNQLNDYSGTTHVKEGNLQVGQGGNGTRAVADTLGRTGTGATYVDNGAVLSGTGVVQAANINTMHVVRSGGIVAPGDSGGIDVTGTLFIDGSMTVEAGGKLQFDLKSAYYSDSWSAGIALGSFDPGYAAAVSAMLSDDTFLNSSTTSGDADYDHLEFEGALTLNGGAIVELIDQDYITNFIKAGDVFNLMDWSNLILAGFNPETDFVLPSLSGIIDNDLQEELKWDTSLFASHGIVMVTIVPEPGRWLMMLLGLTVIVARRRR